MLDSVFTGYFRIRPPLEKHEIYCFPWKASAKDIHESAQPYRLIMANLRRFPLEISEYFTKTHVRTELSISLHNYSRILDQWFLK